MFHLYHSKLSHIIDYNYIQYVCMLIVVVVYNLYFTMSCLQPYLFPRSLASTVSHVGNSTNRRWHQLNQINIFLPTPPHLIIPPCCILSDPRSLRVISSCQMCPHRAPWLTEMYLFVFFIDGWILLVRRKILPVGLISHSKWCQSCSATCAVCKVSVFRVKPGPPPLGLGHISSTNPDPQLITV